jgi:arylsulfatase A-like enzyme
MTESDYSDKPAFLDRARGEPELLARVRDDGRRSLMAVDEMVDRFGRLLRRLGELRDTLVVFTSDNGIMLGEHGGVVGKDLPYPASTRIPLLVRWPGRATAGRTRTDFVTNVDVAATFLDAAGVHRQTDGWPLFSGHRRRTLFGEAFGARNRRGAQVLPPWRSLTTRSYRYAEYTDQGHHLIAREYYDHRTDPWELENRAATLAQSRIDRLSGLLRELGRCRGASCP